MDLSDAQLGKYMMTKEDFNFQGSSYDPAQHNHWTRYRMMKEGDDPYSGAKDVGILEVQHKKDWSINRYAGPVGLPTTASGPEVPPEHNQGWNETWASRTAVGERSNPIKPGQNEGEIPGQIPLLLHHSTRATDEVDTMIMSREGRSMASTMLGVAANAALATTGRDLGAPESLSPHSRRTVAKLKEVGAVPESHTSYPNDLTFVPSHESPIKGGLEGLHSHLIAQSHRNPGEPGNTPEVPLAASEAKAGQRSMRNVLRAGRTRAVEESEQLRLF